MSDLSRVLGLDRNPAALSALNTVGQSLALSAGQAALDKSHLPINLSAFVPTVPALSASSPTPLVDPTVQQNTVQQNTVQQNTVQHNGLKTVFHALIEGVGVDGLTVGQYIAAVEARLDAWVDSVD